MDSVEDLEICCYMTPINRVEPDDDSVDCRMFSIEVSATFIPPIAESDVEEDDSVLLDADFDRIDYVFLIEEEKFLAEDTSAETVREILVEMKVPVQSSLVEAIVEFVRKTGSNEVYSNRKVVHVRVKIDVPVALDDGGGANGVLEKIRIEECRGCAICLEEMGRGTEGRRMPNCEHVYHEECILNWLGKGRSCPLCRSRI